MLATTGPWTTPQQTSRISEHQCGATERSFRKGRPPFEWRRRFMQKDRCRIQHAMARTTGARHGSADFLALS